MPLSNPLRGCLPWMLLLLPSTANCLAQDKQQEPAAHARNARAGNATVAEIMETFAPRGVMSDGSSPTPPEQALNSFHMKEGFDIDLIAGEPSISQPLFLSWDSQGRMWVVQYRQYQYPAGLKVVRFDHHLRAEFDRVPEPPPNHVRGQDRITVFEDTDGDGIYDSHRDVITGLNIASSVAIGRGGIWVLNPPYLLFYPDADGDAVPDGDPQVHLRGFGLQDTHSIANSLMWGPDGWLYGANGSTTGGTVSSRATPGIPFQGQCIWRYHPTTQVFEIYAEGGGNTFSLDIDSKGRVFCGTNGGNTRGWYLPQGSYSHKNWGKHGPLTNPYAFGFFQAMRFEGDGRRFPQAFLVYEGGLFPDAAFAGSIIAPNAMQNLVWHSRRIPDGSTFRTIDEENLLECDDRWFRPVYAGVGPDGCVYLADWYDTRLSHVSPTDDWHKESGRIYRIRPTEQDPRYASGDLGRKPPVDLLPLLDHGNKWVRQRAALELGWRPELSAATVDKLVDRVEQSGSLEALWALGAQGHLNEQRAKAWLQHASPHLRRWVVRLLGDRHESHPGLIRLANSEEDVEVRSQLAATARRVDASTGLAIARALMNYDRDATDLHLPLMIWWAVEAHAEDWGQIQRLAADPELWQRPLMRDTVASRLMQRYASTGKRDDLQRCAQLVQLAPDEAAREQLMLGLNQAFQGRTMPPLPPALEKAVEAYRSAQGNAGVVLALQQGDAEACAAGLKLLQSSATDLAERLDIAAAFGQVRYEPALPLLINLATARATKEPALQRVAIQSLAIYDAPEIGTRLTAAFDNTISKEYALRDTACRTLASREVWALALLAEVNDWRLPGSDLPPDVVQRLRTYDSPQVQRAMDQAFGPAAQLSSVDQAAQIEHYTSLLQDRVPEAPRHDRGAALFAQRCGTCHRLFGSGADIGPPLDNYDRGNLKFWLTAIVAPSIEIREGYQSYLALTADDRVVTGMLAGENAQTITLRTAENQLVVVPREELQQFRALNTSLMPEKALQDLTPEQLRDLFAYLTHAAKPAS